MSQFLTKVKSGFHKGGVHFPQVLCFWMLSTFNDGLRQLVKGVVMNLAIVTDVGHVYDWVADCVTDLCCHAFCDALLDPRMASMNMLLRSA